MESLQEKLLEYEKRMGIGENDPAKKGYLVLVKILNQQIDFLNTFDIKAKIASEEKADAVAYKNAKDLWESLPDTIAKVGKLRVEAKIDGEEKKKTDGPWSPQSIARTSNNV